MLTPEEAYAHIEERRAQRLRSSTARKKITDLDLFKSKQGDRLRKQDRLFQSDLDKLDKLIEKLEKRTRDMKALILESADNGFDLLVEVEAQIKQEMEKLNADDHSS